MKVRGWIVFIIASVLVILLGYSSIYVHEYVHVKQYEALGIPTSGICVAKNYSDVIANDGAVGWVSMEIIDIVYYDNEELTFNQTAFDINMNNIKMSNANHNRMEIEAYIISFGYLFITVAIMLFILIGLVTQPG